MTIIKYYEWMKVFPDQRHIIYEQCFRDCKAEDGYRIVRKLSKEEAMELIQENNLHIVHRNKHGCIWEG